MHTSTDGGLRPEDHKCRASQSQPELHMDPVSKEQKQKTKTTRAEGEEKESEGIKKLANQ